MFYYFLLYYKLYKQLPLKIIFFNNNKAPLKIFLSVSCYWLSFILLAVLKVGYKKWVSFGLCAERVVRGGRLRLRLWLQSAYYWRPGRRPFTSSASSFSYLYALALLRLCYCAATAAFHFFSSSCWCFCCCCCCCFWMSCSWLSWPRPGCLLLPAGSNSH